jgi:hypothetical protein
MFTLRDLLLPMKSAEMIGSAAEWRENYSYLAGFVHIPKTGGSIRRALVR